MKNIRKKIFTIIFSLALAIFAVASCEVGLGSSVDTEPPTLIINTPESASIIRGDFTITGTWTDDQTVENVYCILRNTNNQQLEYDFGGEVITESNGEGSWSILIETEFVADGSYEAAVSVVDGVGHETVAVRQIVIDNTEPVIVLKRPSSRLGEAAGDIDGYGQLFTLKGLAADDSGVGLIEVSIYGDEALTNLLKTISIKNVPNTISLDVAEFIEGETNDYSEIYGSTSRTAGEQKRWCEVVAYDGAQFYPSDGTAQSENDKKGNASTGYYLYEDLSSTILNEYKITELYAMRNGTYNGERSVINSTLSALEEKKIEAGVFTLNPANNPTYTVSGYQELKKDGTDFGEAMSVKNGNSLVITVKPGLDSYEINQETLKVYLQQCDRNGNAVGNLIPMENITKEQSGTSYIVTVPVTKDENIQIGKNYLLHVTGQDEKHNEVKAKNNGYGFYFDTNGVKPSLKVTNPPSAATVSYNNSLDSITLTGTVNFPSDTCENGSVIIKDSSGNLEWRVGNYTTTDTDIPWTYNLEFKKGRNESADYTGKLYLPDGNQTLYIYAVTGYDFDNAANIVYVERNIKVDTLIPNTPSLTTVKGSAYNSVIWYDSQSLQVGVSASDSQRNGYSSGLFKTEYYIGNLPNDYNNISWTSLATTSSGYINGLTEGDNKVYLHSVDFVSNGSPIDSEVYSTVRVDTVLPKITKASIGNGTTGDEFTAGSILNIQGNHAKKIQLEIEEDNLRTPAAEGIIVTLVTPNEANPSNPTIVVLPGSVTENGTTSDGTKKWIWTSSDEAPLNTNTTITIDVVVKDKVERQNPASAEYKVLVDTRGPDIEITTPREDLYGQNSLRDTTTLQAGISDAAGTVAVTKYKLTSTSIGDDSAIITQAKNASNTTEFALDTWVTAESKGFVTLSTGTIDHGKWYFYVYSIDDAGNESVAQRYFWFDNDDPQLGIADANQPKSKYNSSETVLSVRTSGTASDSNGIKEVKYNLDDNGWTVPTTWNSSSFAWTLDLSFDTDGVLSQGNHVLKIRAIDNADRETIQTYNILIDTVLPVVTIGNKNDTVIRYNQTFKNWHNSAQMDVDFTVEDATTPIFVYYSIDTNPGASADWSNMFNYNADTKRATGTIEFESNGERTVYVKAVDGAGNIKIENFKRYVDTEINTFNAKYSKTGTDGAINNFGGTTYVNGTVGMTFWGEFKDNLSGVKEIVLKLDDNDETTTDNPLPVTIKYSTTQLSENVTSESALPSDFLDLPAEDAEHPENRTGIKSWRAEVNGNAFTQTGKLKLIGYDLAGNEVVAQEILNINFDTDPPEINTNTISITDTTSTNAYRSSTTPLKYYVNKNGNFTIKGVSYDSKGMASTKLTIGTYQTTSSSASSWNFAVNNLSTLFSDDSVTQTTATITSTDLAGNTASENIILMFDNTSPVRSEVLKIDNIDYSDAMWGKNTVLAINGTVTDAGSGPAKVYYERFESNDVTATPTKEGTITVSGTTFNGNVTGLEEGDNYIRLIAEDNVGNKETGVTTLYYVRVDTRAPSLASTSGGTQFTNGSTPVTVEGSCSDDGSGIASVIVSVTIGTETKTAEATFPSSGTWTATIPASDLSGITNDGEYDIKVIAKDVAGNESSPLTVAKLKGDTDAPTATLNSIVQSVETGTGADKKFFVRPDTTLTVKGVTEDTLSTTVYTWLKLEPYNAAGTGTAIQVYESTDTNHTGTTARSWTLTIPAGTITATSGYTGAKLYVCTKDLAGNEEAYEKANLVFDTTGPVYMLPSDDPDDSNIEATKVSGIIHASANYYNSENLIISGTWKDAMAGVSTVYYEIIPENGTATISRTNLDETITNAEGVITYKYNPFTVKNKGNGLYTFNSEIRGFASGANTLIMYAKDALGNVSSDSKEFTIKVDTVAPTASEYTDENVSPAYTYSFTNSYLTDGNSDKTLYFYATDAASGIDKTEAPVITLGRTDLTSANGSNAIYAASETPGSGYKVTVTIKQADLTSGYQPVVVTITDKAGNKARINLGSMDVDSEDPIVVLKNPADADIETEGVQVNGTITIKGTAADKNLKEHPLTKLEYQRKLNNTSWTEWIDLITDFSSANTDITNAAEFSVILDTTDASKFTDGSIYKVRATVEDEAGRTKTSDPITFTVDQDTDRPVITFMDITVPDIAVDSTSTDPAILHLVNSRKLRVTVSDDDGIESFATKVGSTTLTAASSSNGTYVYNLPNAITDGTHNIEFTVVDTATNVTADRTFISTTDKAPKLTDGTHKMNKASATVKLMLDSIAPVSSGTQYAYYTGTYPATPAWAATVPALGGTREKLAIKIVAGDENKIESVTAKISTSTGTGVSTTTGERDSTITETQESDGKYYSTWIIKDIDVSETAIPTGGNYKLELTITDGANNTRTDSVQLSIDRDAPRVDITTPKAVFGNNTTYSSGSIKANGSISGASTLRYAVSSNGTTAPSTYSDTIDFSTTWNIDFDGDTTAATGVHTELLNTHLVNFGFTTEDDLNKTNNPYSDITPLYLWLKAEDDVGNKTETPFLILVNPQGDRPTIKISNPQVFEQVFGNTVSIYGTHQDTLGESADKIGVKSAWVQIISEAQGDETTYLMGYMDPAGGVYNRLAWFPKSEVSDAQLPTDANGVPISRITAFRQAKVDLDYLASIKDASNNPVYEIYNMKTYKGDGTDKKWAATASATTINDKEEGYAYTDYAILAKISGASWNLSINSQGEFNPNASQNPKRNLVAIQVYAKDGDGKLNTVTENKYVFFDSDTPLITDLKLEQYDSSNNIIATRTYTPDMYISFRNNTTWKLKGKAEDDRCITSLKIDNVAQTITGSNASENFTCSLTKTGTVGTISIPIEAKDDANHTGLEEISIRFDDQAPEHVTSGDSYNIKTIIQQDNGFYKFGSVAKEEPASDGTSQSGFAYTAFYFMRGNKLYDILKPKASSTLSENASAANSGFTYDSQDHLYWYTKTVTARTSDINVLTIDSSSDMTGIHKNGLVKIDGTYYRITDTTDNTFTIDGNPVKTTTTVKVAAAALIDNTAKEKAKDGKTPSLTDGYYVAADLDFDDGDRMIEYVYKSGTSWEWEASVSSKNIADGPVKLVYVVFDAAGNFVYDTVDGIISNNTPRIAGFSVYTDYNNNGTVDDEGKDGKYEYYLASTYSAKSVTGTTGTAPNIKNVYNPDKNSVVDNQKHALKNKIVAYTADPNDETARLPVLTLRGKTVIKPEIVGGNGKVYYDYSINGTAGSNAKELFTGSTDYTINSKDINIQLGDLVSIGDVGCTEFKFTFRDEMEDRDILDSYSFTTAQKEEVNAYLSVYMGIAAAASNPPVVKINPFYWKGIKDNSIYGSSTANSYKDLKGHIELEDDWADAPGFNASDNEYDADPKISGQVVVTGTVHDANLINEMKVSFGTFINNVTVAAFNTTTGALTASDSVAESTYATNGYWFEINEETFSGDGHDVEWTLYLNTEKFGVKLNTELKVTASNNGTPTCTPSDAADDDSEEILNIAGNKKYAAATYSSPKTNTPGTTNTTKTIKTAYYRMDIVPYITDIQTSLSSANKNNHSVYSRTALGHYPVYMTHAQGNTPTAFEQGIKVYGFNLANGTITLGGTSDNSQSLTAATGYYTFNLPSGARKGVATVTVGTGANAVSTLNNVNNDDSRGDYKYTVAANGTRTDNLGTVPLEGDYTKYTNFYNRMPNKVNNNNLTDNVYFDVWDFNTQAAKAYGNGQLDNVVMKVSPTSGMLGFAFSNGSERFSMGGTNVEDSTEYSYLEWNRSFDYMQSTSFAYDSKGHTYGTAAGGDINKDLKWDALSFMTDRWSQPILGSGQYGNPSVNKESNVVKQIEGIGQNGDAKTPTGSTKSVRKDRFQSLSYATMRNKNDNGTYIYLAYYDLLNDEIRFKAGELADTDANDEKYYHNYPGVAYDRGKPHDDFGNFVKKFEYNDTNYSTNAALCQIVATNTTTGEYPQSNTLGSVGNAVAIGVTSDNIVVMAWYDGTDLKYSYNNAFAGIKAGTDNTAFNTKVKETARVKASKEGWSNAVTLISGAGEYCQLEVAADNSIHVAAYDSMNSALKYAYLEDYHFSTADGDTTTPKVCIVDSYLDAGTQLSLDVAAERINGTIRYIPHIGYWAAYPEKPRYAYLADPDTFFSATTDDGRSGAVKDKFTTIWECGVVPVATGRAVKEGKVNVGLWKATVIPEGAATQVKGYRVASNNTGFSTGTSAAATDKGKCYGNGTDNAVLAYVTMPSSSTYYIETAQMQ